MKDPNKGVRALGRRVPRRTGKHAAARDDPPASDIERLAHVLMTAFQRGMLLAQATGSVAPLGDAMNTAIDVVRRLAAGHAPQPEQRRVG